MSNRSKAFWAQRSTELPYNTKATRKWGKEAQWIHGEGAFASLAYCPSSGMSQCLTIQLYDTLEDALNAQHNLQCGGQCRDIYRPNETQYHQIWDLTGRGFRRVQKIYKTEVSVSGGAQ